jgi:hypothetical protein
MCWNKCWSFCHRITGILLQRLLQEEEPAVFSQELFNTLLHYYEEILGMAGAGRRPKPKHFTVLTRKIRNASLRVAMRLLVTRPSRHPSVANTVVLESSSE